MLNSNNIMDSSYHPPQIQPHYFINHDISNHQEDDIKDKINYVALTTLPMQKNSNKTHKYTNSQHYDSILGMDCNTMLMTYAVLIEF